MSSRLFAAKLRAVYAAAKGKHSAPPVSLMGQLLWREFYYAAALGTPNFGKMVGNPVCRQIPWAADAQLLTAWEEGRTGYPWIDAAMTQLRQQGWIHHLARHAVACFLTRGDLWQSWERGAEVFDRLLLDADPALNNGNWYAAQRCPAVRTRLTCGLMRAAGCGFQRPRFSTRWVPARAASCLSCSRVARAVLSCLLPCCVSQEVRPARHVCTPFFAGAA